MKVPGGYMLVTLGDGRVVECASGIQKLDAGPMPRVLASEVSRPMSGTPIHDRDIDFVPPTRHNGQLHGNDAERHAPVPVMLRARFDSEPPAPPVPATKATKRIKRRAA
jgi:hypothetical protein